MIVKVQLSLATTHDHRRVLIQDATGSLEYEGPATADVQEAMGTDARAFFDATLDRQGRVVLGRRRSEQSW